MNIIIAIQRNDDHFKIELFYNSFDLILFPGHSDVLYSLEQILCRRVQVLLVMIVLKKYVVQLFKAFSAHIYDIRVGKGQV